MFNPMDLSSKTIVIAGASAGIGRESAIYMSRLGAKIALVARREEELKETLSQMEGEGHRIYCYDFSDTGGIENLVSTIVADMGAVWGMLYCVATHCTMLLPQCKTETIKKALKTNVYSYVELVRCLTKKKNMLDGGSIVAVSSIASADGEKGQSVYSLTKAAMDAASRCMARELADRRIRVNTIRPAWVNTSRMKMFSDRFSEEVLENEPVYKRMCLGVTEPEEVAALAAFLLCEATKTITGAFYHIDSGATRI